MQAPKPNDSVAAGHASRGGAGVLYTAEATMSFVTQDGEARSKERCTVCGYSTAVDGAQYAV